MDLSGDSGHRGWPGIVPIRPDRFCHGGATASRHTTAASAHRRSIKLGRSRLRNTCGTFNVFVICFRDRIDAVLQAASPPSMLTRKQLDLLRFIQSRMQECGVPPSFDEMKDALDLKSKSGIHRL